MKHLLKLNTTAAYDEVSDNLAIPNYAMVAYDTFVGYKPSIQPIEYIQGTGTQYLDLNIFGDLETELEICFTALETSKYIAGNNDNSSMAISLFVASSANQRFGDKYVTLNLAANTQYTIVTNKSGITINGTTTARTTTTPFTTAGKLFVMRGQTSATTFTKMKLYYVKVRKHNNLILNLTPVKIGSVGYMFDDVSKKLFKNGGTGTFTCGPNVA